MRCLVGLIIFSLSMAAPHMALAESKSGGSQNIAAKEDLVRQYMAATHRSDRLRVTYEKQLKLAWAFCKNEACQAELDRTIDDAVTHAVTQYEQGVSELLAQRLTEEDLRAAIKFARSSEGQAIIEAENGMSGEIALLGHEMSLATQQEVSRQFCPKHTEICPAPRATPARTAVSKSPN